MGLRRGSHGRRAVFAAIYGMGVPESKWKRAHLSPRRPIVPRRQPVKIYDGQGVLLRIVNPKRRAAAGGS